MRRGRLLIVLAFAALSACAAQTTGPAPIASAPPPPPPPPELEAGSWSLASIAAAPPPAPLSVSFSGDSLEGRSFCNRFFGGYTKKGSSLLIGAIGSTRMACPHLDAEQAFFGAFTETSGYEIDSDGHLTLIDRQGGRDLVFARP